MFPIGTKNSTYVNTNFESFGAIMTKDLLLVYVCYSLITETILRNIDGALNALASWRDLYQISFHTLFIQSLSIWN